MLCWLSWRAGWFFFVVFRAGSGIDLVVAIACFDHGWRRQIVCMYLTRFSLGVGRLASVFSVNM